ncbi:MAG: anti-sigma factor family protein [Thermotogota bacterium]
MNCNEFRDKYMDRYLDNEMNSKEIREFREHMKECKSCHSIFLSYQEVMNYQKIRASYSSSDKGKRMFLRRVKRRKHIPYQIAAGFAILTIGIFGSKTFMDFNRVNQRYETIVNKSVEMLNSAQKSDKDSDLGVKNASGDVKSRTEQIFNLINDGEKE